MHFATSLRVPSCGCRRPATRRVASYARRAAALGSCATYVTASRRVGMRAAARLSSALAAAGAGGASLASAIAFGSPAGTEARSTPTSMGGGAVSFSPAPPPSDRPDMRLALVQVLSRHGDRTSINPLPSETREQWESLLPTDEASSTLDARATPTPPNPRLLDARKPESWHGQLTTQGVAQLVHTGAALRAWLVDERALLPASLTDARSAGAVKIRSTSTRRTVQSAQSLILGLYPAETDSDAVASSSRATSPEPLPIEVRDRMRESMFPNPGMACERQIELMRSLDGDPSVKAAEAAAWERASLTAVRQEVHRRNLDARRAERELAAAKANAAGVSSPDSVGGEATVADVSERPASSPATNPNASPNDVSSASKRARDPRLPSATSVWEPLQARANHSLSLPGGVEDDDLAAIRRAAEARYINRATNAEGAALAGGRLLRELADEAHAVARGGSPTRLSVYSGHDSSIIALLAVLGAFGGEWPPVASTVVVETWTPSRDARAVGRPHWSARLGMAKEEGEDMVRVVFNGEVLPLEGCAGQDSTRGGGLCSLDAFRAMAHARDPKDYRAACVAAAKL